MSSATETEPIVAYRGVVAIQLEPDGAKKETNTFASAYLCNGGSGGGHQAFFAVVTALCGYQKVVSECNFEGHVVGGIRPSSPVETRPLSLMMFRRHQRSCCRQVGVEADLRKQNVGNEGAHARVQSVVDQNRTLCSISGPRQNGPKQRRVEQVQRAEHGDGGAGGSKKRLGRALGNQE